MLKIKTIKHYKNLLKASNEIKEYVRKICLLDLINDFKQVFLI